MKYRISYTIYDIIAESGEPVKLLVGRRSRRAFVWALRLGYNQGRKWIPSSPSPSSSVTATSSNKPDSDIPHIGSTGMNPRAAKATTARWMRPASTWPRPNSWACAAEPASARAVAFLTRRQRAGGNWEVDDSSAGNLTWLILTLLGAGVPVGRALVSSAASRLEQEQALAACRRTLSYRALRPFFARFAPMLIAHKGLNHVSPTGC